MKRSTLICAVIMGTTGVLGGTAAMAQKPAPAPRPPYIPPRLQPLRPRLLQPRRNRAPRRMRTPRAMFPPSMRNTPAEQ